MTFDTTLWAAGHVAPSLVRGLAASWRYRQLEGDGGLATNRYRAGLVVHALWHAQLLPLALRHVHENLGVMISQHRDGEIISRILAPLGYRPVRGSSTRGGAAALRELTQAASEGHPLAITTDGPRGPARKCKPGVVRAASELGWPIVPAAALPTRTWHFNSWDSFLLPKPGSTVYLRYGDPIIVPRELEQHDLQNWQDRVGSAIDRATALCAEAAAKGRRKGGDG